jgi:hypothetical protein
MSSLTSRRGTYATQCSTILTLVVLISLSSSDPGFPQRPVFIANRKVFSIRARGTIGRSTAAFSRRCAIDNVTGLRRAHQERTPL